MDDRVKSIAEMVAQGNTGESLQNAVQDSLREIEDKIEDLQRQAAAIRSLGHYYAPGGVASVEQAAGHGADASLDTSTPKKRWRLIHDAAVAVGQDKEMLDVKDVVAELKKMGADFPYSNVGAAVGTVLRDSPEFRRIGGGLWRVVGVEPDPGPEETTLDQAGK